MQLYVADYLGDTRHLTTEQHGAYLLLLMAMWRAGGELVNDPAKLARMTGCTPSRWAKISSDVLAFFTAEGGALTHGRVTEELRKALEKRDQRAASGARGGKAKALKTNKTKIAKAKVLLKQSSEPEPEITPSTSNDVLPPPEATPTKAKTRNDFISASWVVSEALLQFGEQRGMTRQEINDAADEFRDYWGSRRDAKARRGDWDLSFKARLRELAGRVRADGARLAAAPGQSGGGRRGSGSFADIYARRHGYAEN